MLVAGEVARHVDLIGKVVSCCYRDKPPSRIYTEKVVKQLFMVVAHESGGFAFRRQQGFGRSATPQEIASTDPIVQAAVRKYMSMGAFGICQCEWGSLTDSFLMLINDTTLYTNSIRCLSSASVRVLDETLAPGNMEANRINVLVHLTTKEGDDLSYLCARLHFLRFPSPVPETLEEMAKDAKKYYNTRLGSATPEMYLRAFKRYWPEKKGESVNV